MSHLWTDGPYKGGFVLFDNGYNHTDQSGNGLGWSHLTEYSFDASNMTIEKVWEHAEPNGGFALLMGDVRKLDETYLVSWSELGRLEELSQEGESLWRLEVPLGTITGRVNFVPKELMRAR